MTGFSAAALVAVFAGAAQAIRYNPEMTYRFDESCVEEFGEDKPGRLSFNDNKCSTVPFDGWLDDYHFDNQTVKRPRGKYSRYCQHPEDSDLYFVCDDTQWIWWREDTMFCMRLEPEEKCSKECWDPAGGYHGFWFNWCEESCKRGKDWACERWEEYQARKGDLDGVELLGDTPESHSSSASTLLIATCAGAVTAAGLFMARKRCSKNADEEFMRV